MGFLISNFVKKWGEGVGFVHVFDSLTFMVACPGNRWGGGCMSTRICMQSGTDSLDAQIFWYYVSVTKLIRFRLHLHLHRYPTLP